MLPLSDEELEFSTALSSDTHGMEGVWMWLILNSDWVLFTKTYTQNSLKHAALAIHLHHYHGTEEQDLFTCGELERLRWLTNRNEEVIVRYTKGNCGAEELLAAFVRFSPEIE
jgi:hypothetical protein